MKDKDVTWMIVDGNYMAYRAFFASKERASLANGIVFGFLSDVLSIQRQLFATNIVFCFDEGKSKRKEVYSGYKAERLSRKDPHERKMFDNLKKQIRDIQYEYLPLLGFKNIFSQDGYEADDIIASVCQNTRKAMYLSTIVSSDRDFYQLLVDNEVEILHPSTNETVTASSFWDKHLLHPKDWVAVKCLAGCKSDSVPGIPQVGETTACHYLSGRLSPSRNIYKTLERVEKEMIEKNEKLVRLPFPGVRSFRLTGDKITVQQWRKGVKELGMESLMKRQPLSVKEKI